MFDPSSAGELLGNKLAALSPGSGCCKQCSKPLLHPLSVVSLDVDQAYESCSRANVAKSWSWAASTFETQFSTQFVQIKRGKKFEARLGSESWSRGWWVLSLKQLSSALHAATMGTYAAIGNLVVELDGMSIGGVMSNAAVSTRFAFEESFNPHQGAIDWLRYVDDVLGFSRCMCGSCLQSFFFQNLYSERVSPVYNSDTAEVRVSNGSTWSFTISQTSCAGP